MFLRWMGFALYAQLEAKKWIPRADDTYKAFLATSTKQSSNDYPRVSDAPEIFNYLFINAPPTSLDNKELLLEKLNMAAMFIIPKSCQRYKQYVSLVYSSIVLMLALLLNIRPIRLVNFKDNYFLVVIGEGKQAIVCDVFANEIYLETAMFNIPTFVKKNIAINSNQVQTLFAETEQWNDQDIKKFFYLDDDNIPEFAGIFDGEIFKFLVEQLIENVIGKPIGARAFYLLQKLLEKRQSAVSKEAFTQWLTKEVAPALTVIQNELSDFPLISPMTVQQFEHSNFKKRFNCMEVSKHMELIDPLAKQVLDEEITQTKDAIFKLASTYAVTKEVMAKMMNNNSGYYKHYTLHFSHYTNMSDIEIKVYPPFRKTHECDSCYYQTNLKWSFDEWPNQGMSVQFLKTKEKFYLCFPANILLYKLIKPFIGRGFGNLIDIGFNPKWTTGYDAPRDVSFWSTPREQQIYSIFNYPMVIKYIGYMLQQRNPNTPLVIREYGGGHGELARLLLKEYGTAIRYQFTEPNQEAYVEAEKKLIEYDGLFLKKRMSVNDNITDTLKNEPWEQSDVVIASGVFAQGVLSTNEAAEGFIKILENSKENTYFIVTGFSPSLINSRSLAKFNLEILNIRHPLINEYLYVFRKPSATKISNDGTLDQKTHGFEEHVTYQKN